MLLNNQSFSVELVTTYTPELQDPIGNHLSDLIRNLLVTWRVWRPKANNIINNNFIQSVWVLSGLADVKILTLSAMSGQCEELWGAWWQSHNFKSISGLLLTFSCFEAPPKSVRQIGAVKKQTRMMPLLNQ